MKYKAFFITFKGLSVNPIMQSFFFGSWEPDFKEEICKNTFFYRKPPVAVSAKTPLNY